MKAPILQYPDFEKPFTLYTDASGTGLGAVLAQKDSENKERVIAYASKSLNKAELNYGITDKECLAVIWAIKHFEQYLGLLPFQVVTDHSALKYLQTAKVPTGQRAWWIMYLQQFEFEIVHRPGKENRNADALSRIPEIECNFIRVEIEEGEGTPSNFSELDGETNLSKEKDEIDYEGDSEDNTDNDSNYSNRHYTYTSDFSRELLKDLDYEIKEIEELQKQRKEKLEKLRITADQIKANTSELLGEPSRKRKSRIEVKDTGSDDESITKVRSPIAYSCYSEIWCNCNVHDLFEYPEESDDEIEQKNESYYSEKHAEEIISHYGDNFVKNENGWGPEYYDNETLNETWGLPDLSDEGEQQIEEIWEVWTVA